MPISTHRAKLLKWSSLIGLLLILLTLPVPTVQAAAITVNTTDDEVNTAGDCSLREAIIAANTDTAVDGCLAGNGADIITLPAGVYELNLPGINEDAAQTGDLDLTADATISGAGPTTTAINGNSLDRVIHILDGVAVEISDVTIMEGAAASGGITIASPESFDLNAIIDDKDGGGIAVGAGSALTLTNSRVIDSIAEENGGGIAVDTNGTLVLNNSRVNANQAQSSGGGIYALDASALILTDSRTNGNEASFGGGIFVGNSDVTMTNTLVQDNEVVSYGGGIYAINSTLTMDNSTVNNNDASFGGGIAALSSTLTLSNTDVNINLAGGGGGVNISMSNMTLNNSRVLGNDGDIGGGIFVETSSSLLVTNSLFRGNLSTDSGGAIYSNGTLTMANSTVSGNRTETHGGGLYLNTGSVTNLYNLTISNNTADDDDNDSGDGGGIYIDSASPALTATNTIIAHNFDESPASNVHADCSGPLASGGYNLIEDLSGCTLSGDTTGNLTGVDPLLEPLQDNGGDTLTHALQNGSPAIDAGNPAGCLDQDGLPLATDQRGFVRPVDGGSGTVRCDMGAFEYDSIEPAPPAHLIYLPAVQK